MAIWFDVEDLFEYGRLAARPSGIQRLSYELYAALQVMAPDGIGFLRHDRPAATMRTVEWAEVETLFARMTRPPPRPAAPDPAAETPRPFSRMAGLRTLAARLPREVSLPLGQAARAQITALRSLFSAAAAVPSAFARAHPASDVPSRDAQGADLREVGRPGDVLASFGSPWSVADYPGLVRRMTAATGMRFAMLVYDIIPLIRPEWCDRGLIEMFESSVRGCLPLADTLLAISEASVRDLVAWSAREGIALRTAPRAIPIGTGFTHAAPAPALPRGLTAGGYALFVSTVEARKNHLLAFRAWRRLLDELPPAQVPTLVFAGRIGWLVADLMQQLRNADHLGGKIVIVENPDDAVLAALYRGARFTLFPSLYEGWGLPVSESLSFGKVCIASNSASVPEAGGSFCLYHDPESVTEAAALYRRAIMEPELIAGLEARIQADYRPTPWSASARAVLEAIG